MSEPIHPWPILVHRCPESKQTDTEAGSAICSNRRSLGRTGGPLWTSQDSAEPLLSSSDAIERLQGWKQGHALDIEVRKRRVFHLPKVHYSLCNLFVRLD